MDDLDQSLAGGAVELLQGLLRDWRGGGQETMALTETPAASGLSRKPGGGGAESGQQGQGLEPSS